MIRSPNRPNSEPLTCALPLGLLVHSVRERQAVLRNSGEDLQLRLLDLDFALPRERALSKALSICVEQIGSVRDPSAELMEELTLPDRHALVHALLLTWQTTEISQPATCGQCGHKLELTFDLREIVLPRISDSGKVPLTRRKKKGGVDSIELLLPKAKEFSAAPDELSLLASCLNCSHGEARPWMGLAEEALARLDPLSELEILGKCMDCSANATVRIDPVAYWMSTVRTASAALLQDIHTLAMRYHWSEQEILKLPEVRRQAYLELT